MPTSPRKSGDYDGFWGIQGSDGVKATQNGDGTSSPGWPVMHSYGLLILRDNLNMNKRILSVLPVTPVCDWRTTALCAAFFAPGIFQSWLESAVTIQ